MKKSERLKKIIFQEFYNFFASKNEYVLCINHLDELRWLKREELAGQYEFFVLENPFLSRIHKKFAVERYPFDSVDPEEQLIRDAARNYLNKKYEANLPVRSAIPPEMENMVGKIQFFMDESFLSDHSWKKKGILSLSLILILLSGMLLFLLKGNPGGLIVESNVSGAEVYLDSVQVGKTNQFVQVYLPGIHKVYVRKEGFTMTAPPPEIELSSRHTVRVKVPLQPLQEKKIGYVRILCNLDEAQIFLNNTYYGNLIDGKLLTLPAGEYKIELKKMYYTTTPSSRIVYIQGGDTVEAGFMLVVPEKSNDYSISRNDLMTTLEVSSNVSAAKIFLNDQLTGYVTDHIFAGLAPGTYQIRLEKAGYKFDPPTRSVILSPDHPVISVHFTGKKMTNLVRLKAFPETVRIYVDGELVGKGNFEGELTIGDHIVTLENLPGYTPFLPEKITVSESTILEKELHLIPEFEYLVRIDQNGNIQTKNMSVKTGYVDEVKGVKYSGDVGPDVVYQKLWNTYVWKFGFAFPYRNPKGNDAIQISFPIQFDLRKLSRVKLMITAGITDEKYPMHVSYHPEWRVLFNNFKLYEVRTGETFRENELVTFSWDISTLLKYGLNTLDIYVPEENNVFLFIKEIKVTNKP